MRGLTPIILIIAAVGLFFGYTDSKYTDIKALQVTQAGYDNALSNSQNIVSRRKDLGEKKYNNIKPEDKNKILTLLPDSVDNVKLINDIDQLAKDRGMILEGIKINEGDSAKDTSLGPDKKLYKSIGLSFSVSASYDQFIDFLVQLEKSIRIVDVTSLTLKTGTVSNNYNVSIKTYWLK